jgi:tRNA A-37 threonylcarbamoyl transferase component Bud32
MESPMQVSGTHAVLAVDSGLLGKYRLILELGQGGTAVVYLGALSGPSGFNKLVVLKVLKRELASEEEFRRMFLDEAKLAARLNHPNVVQTNEVFEVEDGRPVIVMEYLEGQPLSRLLMRASEQIPLNLHLKIISEVLNGLHYAHDLTDYGGVPFGLVHRDMTPQNVFVGFDGRVRILDFGIAKLQGVDNETRAGVIKGKLRYMPREQILGEQLDRRADIFAVGVMLWEAATRTKIWKGLSDAAILSSVIHNQVPSPRSVNPDVSEELERVCMKALAFDREDRYANAADLQADVDGLLAGQPVSGRAIGQFVGSVFEKKRAEANELIQRALQTATFSSAPAVAVEEAPISVRGLTPAGTFAGGSSLTITAPKPAWHRSMWIGAAAAVLGVAGVGYALRAKDGPAVGQAAPSTALSAVIHAKPEKPAGGQVRAHIEVSPPSAQIYMDDKPLESNPYTGYLDATVGAYVIRAEAEGFEPQSSVVTADREVDLKLSLRPLKANEPPPPARTATARRESRPAPAATTASTAPAPAKNCNPPYTLDADGIHRFKPECL